MMHRSSKRRATRRARASNRRARKTQLTNGLTVLTEKIDGFQSVSIGIWVRAGTRHERPHEAGISHFLEHMLFKGTETRTAMEITRAVEGVGGEFNAFTTREYTCFYVNLLARDLELGLEILSDIVLSSTFDGEELERERKVISQEIAMVEETPEELSQDIYFELLYGRHGLGRPILGTENSVRKMRRSDLLRYFRKHYRPDNLVVSVAGNVNHARVLRALGGLRKRNWPGRPVKKLSAREEGFLPAPKINDGLWWVARPTEQAHLVWGVEAPRFATRSQAAILVLAAFLGGGMSSLLFQEIREKNGLAYTVYSNLSAFLDSGILSVYVGCSKRQVATCLRLIEDAVERVATLKMTEEELREVKESLKGTLLMSMDSVESLMQGNAIDEIYHRDSFAIEEICNDIDGVSAGDVRRAARRLFVRGRRAVLVYGPRPTPTTRRKLKPHFPKKYRK